MKNLLLLLIVFFVTSTYAQNKTKEISIFGADNFYTTKQSQGSQNDVVRLGQVVGIAYQTSDSAKARGIIIEFLANNTLSYYDKILSGNRLLEVDDVYTNLNFLFTLFYFKKGPIQFNFNVGFGIGTLADRQFYDEGNNLLPSNSTTLPKINFGKILDFNGIIEPNVNLKMMKRLSIIVGLRYTTAKNFKQEKNIYFNAVQGVGLGFKIGGAFQLKK